MKEKLEAILKTLEDARRQIVEMRESDGQPGNPLDDIELGIDWIKKKLEELRDPTSAP